MFSAPSESEGGKRFLASPIDVISQPGSTWTLISAACLRETGSRRARMCVRHFLHSHSGRNAGFVNKGHTNNSSNNSSNKKRQHGERKSFLRCCYWVQIRRMFCLHVVSRPRNAFALTGDSIKRARAGGKWKRRSVFARSFAE